MYRPLESEATLAQSRAIASALDAEGIPSQLVTNELNEPLAVVARGGLNLHGVMGSLALHHLNRRAYASDATSADAAERRLFKQTLPVAGSTVLPASHLRLIDTVVRASSGKSDVLAWRMGNNSREDNMVLGSKDFCMHTDYPNLSDAKTADKPLHGLNVHDTRAGACTVIVGLLRSFEDVARIAEIDNNVPEVQAVRERLYRTLGAPFTTLTVEAGDVLIFQASHHAVRGLLPVVHKFTTITEARLSDIYRPSYAPAAKVLPLRQHIAERYPLEAIGYAA